MNTTHVLLLEDDPSTRRFVAMALDDAPITLMLCDSVIAASRCLEAGPVDVVLSDLRVADGSALPFLEALARRGGPRVAVFSAGVTPDDRARLVAAGVSHVLDKPVAVGALRDCVLGARPVPASPATLPYFGGNAALASAYVASCREQFPRDVLTGDAACAAHDLAALHRIAHSLRTVLQILGHPADAACAVALDQACAAGDHTAVQAHWQRLRAALARIAAD